MKALVIVCAAMCFWVGPLAAEFDGLSMYEGLVETESVSTDNTSLSNNFYVNQLDAHIAETDQTIEELGELYRTIVTQAERDEGKFFRTWDRDRYMAMKDAAASFQTKVKALHEKLTSAVNLTEIVRNESLSQDLQIEVMERVAKLVRNVTHYNTLIDFGCNRALRFDNAVPCNELRSHILEPRTFYIQFPSMFVPFGAEERATEILSLPMEEAKLRALLQQANELVNKALETRESMIASGVKESTRCKYGSRRTSIEYTCKLHTFEETHKPRIVDFVLTMVELKGCTNELTAMLALANNHVDDLDIRVEYEQLRVKFTELANWGDSWIVTYDPWNKTERWFEFFPGEDFVETHLFSKVTIKSAAEWVREREARR